MFWTNDQPLSFLVIRIHKFGGGLYFTTVFQVLNLSLHKLKYSCNVKDIECLKCIISIECFILQHVSRSPDYKSEVNNSQPEEQSLCNVSQHIDNDPNDNQQVQSPVNKSDYWLEQLHTSPDEPQHSFPWKYHSTPKKSGTSCSKEKLCYGGNTDAAKHRCAYGRSLYLICHTLQM